MQRNPHPTPSIPPHTAPLSSCLIPEAAFRFHGLQYSGGPFSDCVANTAAGTHSQRPPSASCSETVESWRKNPSPASLPRPPGLAVWVSRSTELAGEQRKNPHLQFLLPLGGHHAGWTSSLLCGWDQLPRFSAFCYDTISCSLLVPG